MVCYQSTHNLGEMESEFRVTLAKSLDHKEFFFDVKTELPMTKQ